MSLSRPRIWIPHQQPSWPLTINRRNPLTRGLIAAWPFLPAGGNTLYDVGGNGLHGVPINSPPWSTTAIGLGTLHNGMAGAGNARAWRIPYHTSMDASHLTIASIAASSTAVSGSTNQAIVNYGTTTPGTWHMFLSTLGSYRFQVRVDGGVARIAVGSSPTSGIHSFALTYRDPDLIGYLDGMQDATESTGGTLDINQGDLYIGSHPDEEGDKDWEQPILLVVLAGRAWTPTEVQLWHSDPWALFIPTHRIEQQVLPLTSTRNYYAGGLGMSKRIQRRGLAW